MVQATADSLNLDRHLVWDCQLSNDLQISILAISLFNAKKIKTHFTNIKKKSMFCTFMKANTMNAVCIYVYTNTHGVDGCSYILVKQRVWWVGRQTQWWPRQKAIYFI